MEALFIIGKLIFYITIGFTIALLLDAQIRKDYKD